MLKAKVEISRLKKVTKLFAVKIALNMRIER